MAKCKACGAGHVERTVLQTYQDDVLIGAPFTVVLEEVVVEERCASCGAFLGFEVPDLEGLIAAVAMVRATFPQKLDGAEIRFLRMAAGWRATKLADTLGVDPATVSRWETGTQTISDSYEKHLRSAVCLKLYPSAPLVRFEPDDVLRLKISSARAVGDEIVIFCWRAPVEGIDEKWDYGREARKRVA